MVSVAQIDSLLPQTQCRQCGFAGCRPYAEAISEGRAEINQCPPGGEFTLRALAGLLGRQPLALNPANGRHKPPQLAVILESQCIGCTLCIQACPVDAIVGAARQMHTVIEAECSGCELCLPPCPVDCIELRPADQPHPPGSSGAREQAGHYRRRFQRRQQRLAARQARQDRQTSAPVLSAAEKKQTIAAAVARVKARRKPKA